MVSKFVGIDGFCNTLKQRIVQLDTLWEDNDKVQYHAHPFLIVSFDSLFWEFFFVNSESVDFESCCLSLFSVVIMLME